MTPEEDEHHIISRFIMTRLFPMIDDFSKARGLSLSTDSAVLFMTARRLYLRGNSQEDILQMVHAALEDAKRVTTGGASSTPAPSPPRDQPDETSPLSTKSGRVIAFRPKP